MLIINKHFNFCCFRALAYTTLDRLCAVFLYNNRLKLVAVVKMPTAARQLHLISFNILSYELLQQSTTMNYDYISLLFYSPDL